MQSLINIGGICQILKQPLLFADFYLSIIHISKYQNTTYQRVHKGNSLDHFDLLYFATLFINNLLCAIKFIKRAIFLLTVQLFMSYYYPYYPLYYRQLSLVNAVEAEGVLRRSRLAADIAASRAVAESSLRRSRIEADIIYTESALRRSRIEAEVVAESALRRSRITAEIEADRYAAESALRRSRIEAEIAAEIAADRIATENVIRRSRIQADIATDNALRRSRLAAQIEAVRARRLYYSYI